jgi:hypothetical protein
MANSAKRDKRAADRAELQKKALELRKAGASNDQIAQQLGMCNRAAAWKLVQSALHEIIREPAEDVLALEISRLDAMLLGCWTKAKSGDPHAIDRALRIMDRRASYLGLDAPKTTNHVVVERELERVLNRLEQTLEPEVYAQVLRAIAAEVGGEAASPNGGGEEGEDHGGGEGEGG